MLGFRSVLQAHDEPQLVEAALTDFTAWLAGKRYDTENVGPGRTVDVGPGVQVAIVRDRDEVGSDVLRATLVEKQDTGTWTSVLTVHLNAQATRGWLWLDVHKPDDHDWTATPRLARSLVKSIRLRDGRSPLNPTPRKVGYGQVDEVVQAVLDDRRLGLAFVAGSGQFTRYDKWRDTVDFLLNQTVGQANVWILDRDATERFNYLIGRPHSVAFDTVRTFLPGVVPGDALDAQRHRYLTKTSIGAKPSFALRRVLGQRAREQMLSVRLPDFLRSLDQELRRQQDSALVGELLGPVTESPRQSAGFVPLAKPSPSVVADGAPDGALIATPHLELSQPVGVEVGVAAQPGLAALSAQDLLRELLGVDEPDDLDLDRVRQWMDAGRRAETIGQRLQAHLEAMRDQVEAAEFDRDLAREELESAVQEQISIDEERATAERRLRYLQVQVAARGDASAAWGDPDISILDLRPDSFAELLDRLVELPRLSFTGDAEICRALDKHSQSQGWANKAWDALLSLDDFVRVRMSEGFAGDVDEYLQRTPAGCRSFSANRHAQKESETVENTPKYRNPRVLPVPVAVDPSARVFMGSHYKVANFARVSPRIHYLDDTARTGTVYVGYIGPHLPLPTT